MLEEALKKTKVEIAKALESVGYELSEVFNVTTDETIGHYITLTIKPKED